MVGQDCIGRPNRSASEINADVHVIISDDAEGGVVGVDGIVEEYTFLMGRVWHRPIRPSPIPPRRTASRRILLIVP